MHRGVPTVHLGSSLLGGGPHGPHVLTAKCNTGTAAGPLSGRCFKYSGVCDPQDLCFGPPDRALSGLVGGAGGPAASALALMGPLGSGAA